MWDQSDTDCYSIDKIELHLVSESDEMLQDITKNGDLTWGQ